MKKLLFIPVLALIGAMTSCDIFDSKGNEAKATNQYLGVVQGYIFSDTANNVFSKYITDALAKDSLVNVYKEQSAETNVASLDYANFLCDEKAYNYYGTLLRKEHSLANVKRRIFSASYDKDTTFAKLIEGVEKYDDLPIKEFKVCLAYYNFLKGTAIRKDTILYK